MNRDNTLDYLRGFAILQVVFVHILYWLGLFNTIYLGIFKSFFLFEMPIFFFVTGAVNGLGKILSFRSFCLKRIKGILMPYFIYSAICILIAVLYYIIQSQLSLELIIRLLITWIIPLDHQLMPLPYFTWAIWFVPVYIIAVFLFPVVKSAVLKFGKKTIVICIVLYLIVESVCFFINKNTVFNGFASYITTLLDLLQKTAFYTIFMALGLFYTSLKKRTNKKTFSAAIVFLLCVTGIVFCKVFVKSSLNMQDNKFPPNYMFLIFSFSVLSLIYLLMPIMKKVYRYLIKRMPLLDRFVLYFSKNSIYVFLYQSFSFWVFSIVLRYIGVHNDYLVFVIALIAVYPMIIFTIRIISIVKKRIGSER